MDEVILTPRGATYTVTVEQMRAFVVLVLEIEVLDEECSLLPRGLRQLQADRAKVRAELTRLIHQIKGA